MNSVQHLLHDGAKKYTDLFIKNNIKGETKHRGRKRA